MSQPTVYRWLRALRRSKALAPLFYPYYRMKIGYDVQRLTAAMDPFFQRACGVIHVGAHNGGEILFYAKHRLPVLWVEANPQIFIQLQANLRGVPRQRALLGLVGAEDKKDVEFHVASNNGASSSVFLFDQHDRLWPEISFVQKLRLHQKPLPQLLQEAGIDIRCYDMLVMDVQGAELDVLKGIPNLAGKFSQIQLETSNFPVYSGAPLKAEIDLYLQQSGFQLIDTKVFAAGEGGRQCMDCRYSVVMGRPG